MLLRLFKLSFEIVISMLLSVLYRFNKKFNNIWLICERADEARDNAYYFFTYLRSIHPEINAYFLIDKKSYDFIKLSNNIDRVVQYESLKHKVLFILAEKLLSSHKGMIEPWNYYYYKKLFGWVNREQKYIFLQHGVIFNDVSNLLGREHTLFDLFICGAKQEYNYILDNFGYSKTELVYTGLARFDFYKNQSRKLDNNTILLMPTWRSALKGVSKTEFLSSEYYQNYQSLISNQKLLTLLSLHNIDIVFFLHYEMQQYISCFKSTNSHIIIADKDSYDLSELIASSKLLITDYSSISVDFFYLRKPVIYYHFDDINFFTKHYTKGYFDYKNGFGPSCESEVKVIEEIKKVIDREYSVSEVYEAKYDSFFTWNDYKNCERIYKEVIKLK